MTYRTLMIITAALVISLSSCATLKPVDKANDRGYLLAPTDTEERVYDNARADYRFNYRFGFIDLDTQKIRYFDVKGNSPQHAVVKAIPPGNYRLYSTQVRQKGGASIEERLVSSSKHWYPHYEPFNFNVQAGAITVLPWYFGIQKVVAPAFDNHNELAVSKPLTLEDFCNPIADNHASWVDTWKDEIEHFEAYWKAQRVSFEGQPLLDCQ